MTKTTNTLKKPKIIILATGGTIAGVGNKAYGAEYVSGTLSVDDILQSIPEINDTAFISAEQIANIGSQNITSDIWLTLARRVNALLVCKDVDGIVITHGTDTMEETAYFLNLVVNSSKPVIITGSMRPATARSPDGPNNLFDAVALACDKKTVGRGVLITTNSKVFGAHDVSKMATTHIDAFTAPHCGPLGYVHGNEVQFYRLTERLHTTNSVFSNKLPQKLPSVAILYGYVDFLPALIDACIASNVKGMVYAGTGNGNIPQIAIKNIQRAQEQGIVVVRSSRASYGATTEGEMSDNNLNTIASGILSPQKAKILLQLSLTKTDNIKQIRTYFETH